MRNTKYSSFVYFFLIIGVIGMTVFITGCNKPESIKEYKPIDYSDGEDYKTYIYKEEDTHFSVEYPANYTIVPQIIQMELGNTLGKAVSFAGPRSVNNALIGIQVAFYISGKDLPNVDAAISQEIKAVKTHVKDIPSENFRTIEKSAVIVAGIKGEEIVFSYNIEPYTISGDKMITNPTLLFERYIMLSYKNTILEISTFYDVTLAEQTNADFDHMLQTFKILE